MEDVKKTDGGKRNTIERDVIVNGTNIRVKSVFGDIPLEKVLANIAKRKLAGTGRNDKLR